MGSVNSAFSLGAADRCFVPHPPQDRPRSLPVNDDDRSLKCNGNKAGTTCVSSALAHNFDDFIREHVLNVLWKGDANQSPTPR